MRTNLVRNDGIAFFTLVKGAKVDRRDAKLGKFLENFLSLEWPVIIAHARVIAAHDEMRAAVILASDRVVDRFFRTRIVHLRLEGRERACVFHVISVDQGLVRREDDLVSEVSWLLFTYHGIDEQAIDDSER